MNKKTEEMNLSFEEAMNQLEQIVKKLESGEVPLEDALSEFQTGMELSKYCQDTLTKAEKTVTKMITADGLEQPFEGAE